MKKRETKKEGKLIKKERKKNRKGQKGRNFIHWGFHEKGTLSYLCALRIDR